MRALHYHSAHYLPPALLVFTTIVGYQVLISVGRLAQLTSTVQYLYLLAAEVILCAVYLFWTYWIGMRNIMFANR